MTPGSSTDDFTCMSSHGYTDTPRCLVHPKGQMAFEIDGKYYYLPLTPELIKCVFPEGSVFSCTCMERMQ